MRTLRFLGSSHPSVYAILILVASVHSAYGQTATLSTTSRSFGNIAIGSTSAGLNITLKNTSFTTALAVSNIIATGDFAQTNTCGSSVAARGNCVITVTFTPTATGARTGTLTVTDNATPSTQIASLTGTGIAPVTISPTTRAFGNVAVGSTSAPKTFTVSNKGTTALSLTVTPSANFAQANNCGNSLAGGTSCMINAAFSPTTVGALTGTIVVSYNGFGSPLSVSVAGTGIAPVTMSPTSWAFGNVAVGTTSATKAFTVTNKGIIPQALNITTSPGFTQTNTCGSSLAGGASCSIKAAFAPTSAGAVSGTVAVNYAGFGSPLSATVTGTGIAPVALSPTSLAFSTTQRVGTASAAKTVSILNQATVPLAIQSIVAAPSDYTQTNNCGASIAAKGTCTVSVIFTPHVAGTIPGTLTISDGAVGSPQIVPMTGTGVLTNVLSVAITPVGASMAKGTQLQFKATATYSNGTIGDVTAASAWASTNSAVLSIVSNTGLATGVSAGNANVTATVSGTTVASTQPVTVTAAALASIALSPPNASVDPGGTNNYTATGTYTDGTTGSLAMSSLVLTSDNTSVATINSSGVATGINGGTANIRATAGTITSAPAQLTVTGPTLQSVSIAPSQPSIVKGTTQQFTATGHYSDTTIKDLTTQVGWSSGNSNLTMSDATGTQGLATAVSVGPASVTASWSGGAVTGTMTATVTASPLASITVSPASISVGLGAQQQYAAVGHYNDSTTQDITNQVTWVSGNPAVVGITSSGFATVLGTSTTAIPISATLGAVTSNPPAFLSALSTLPRVCPDASVDMKVLVIDNPAAGYADLPAIKQILDFVGTPYTVMNYTDVTPAGLSDGTCHGYFQGVIMAFGDDIYSGNANLYTTLNSYETTFHVRQVNWFFNPTPDYGFNYSASSVPSTSTYTANFTAAATSVFPMVNTVTPLSFSGAFIFLSPKYTAPTGTITPLLTDASGNVLSAIYAPGNGQEILSQTFDSNQYLKHNLVLAYGLLNWVTKGVFLGDYHVYAAAQVDDFFISDAEWVPGTSCTNPTTHDRTVSDDPSLPTFRLKAADMTALVAWQNSLQNDPLLKGFKLTMAFNGVGTVGNKDWTGLPQSGGANDDLTSTVPSYEKFFHWITHTYDHPNTLNGLHKSDSGGDTDIPPVDSIDLEILTNLFVASGTTQGGANLDVDTSDNPPLGAVTPLNFTDFNPANMVSPGVTGLNDPNVPQYLYADGIRYVVTDTSVIGQPNNGPNPSPNVGIVNSYAPGIYEVPRYPNSIYYNAANWADDEAEFHCIYGPDPGPETPIYTDYKAADILNYTTDTFVVNMLKGDMDPQMFHQPNLHAYDGTISLISDVYNQTFTKYKALYKLPVLSLTLDQLGEGMKARNAYNLAGATGTLVGVGTATPSVAITVPPANQGAVIPVTGLASNGSELYGGTAVSHIQIDPGQTVTLPLQ
jgi:hypothetical protein